MAGYRLLVKPSAAKEIEAIGTKRDRQRIVSRIQALGAEPRPAGCEKLAGIAVQKSLNNPLTANEVADRVLENLKIDDSLTKDDIFSLIDAFRTVDPNDPNSVNFQTFPVVPDAQNVHVVARNPRVLHA